MASKLHHFSYKDCQAKTEPRLEHLWSDVASGLPSFGSFMVQEAAMSASRPARSISHSFT